MLTSLSSLGSVSEAESVSIYGNAALPNLVGLSGLGSVRDLDVGNNDALTSLDGLTLTSITGQLSLDDNDALQNINGLANVTGAIADLEISDSPQLSSIAPLSAWSRRPSSTTSRATSWWEACATSRATAALESCSPPIRVRRPASD